MPATGTLPEGKRQGGGRYGNREAAKIVSRDVGLAVGSICGRHLLNLEDLHYGYWPRDLKVNITNLRIAQENYSNFILQHIPEGVNSILDVGCGIGGIAKRLVEAGYQVDCVSPSSLLTEQARELLQDRVRFFECYYEQLQTDRLYDMVLFSESFQYIKLNKGIEKTLGLLKAGGYILISDFFKTQAKGKSPTSGGHPLKAFRNTVAGYDITCLEDVDITEQTAPNIDLENHLIRQVVFPVADLVERLIGSRHPLALKLVKWVLRKKIQKIELKYLSGHRTGENFSRFKTYRLLLYRRNDTTDGEAPTRTEKTGQLPISI